MIVVGTILALPLFVLPIQTTQINDKIKANKGFDPKDPINDSFSAKPLLDPKDRINDSTIVCQY